MKIMLIPSNDSPEYDNYISFPDHLKPHQVRSLVNKAINESIKENSDDWTFDDVLEKLKKDGIKSHAILVGPAWD